MAENERILYCNCTYAKVVPEATKREVLKALCSSGRPFNAVADLCEMSARKDKTLGELAEVENLKVVACFPRAVHWLFSGSGFPLEKKQVQVFNMREKPAGEIISDLLETELQEADSAPVTGPAS
jgi:hypothetical protein